MRNKAIVLCLLVVAFIAFAGCGKKETVNNNQPNQIQVNQSQKSDNQQTNNQKDNSTKSEFTKDEFNINYKGVIINDTTPFEQIASKLGIELGKRDKNNVDIKASSNVKNINYDWYVVHLPNKVKEDLVIEYAWNESSKTGYIISGDLLNVQTKGALKVGDSIDKIQSIYGRPSESGYNSSTTNFYNYKLEQKSSGIDKTIGIIADKNTKKVTEIKIYYNNDKAMKEMAITSFD